MNLKWMNEQGGKSYVTGTRDIHDDNHDKFIATVAKNLSRQSPKGNSVWYAELIKHAVVKDAPLQCCVSVSGVDTGVAADAGGMMAWLPSCSPEGHVRAGM